MPPLGKTMCRMRPTPPTFTPATASATRWCRRCNSANPAAEQAIARLCRQMRALGEWLTAEAAALLQAAAVQGGYEVETLCRARGPVLDAALHALISPVRTPKKSMSNLLRFLVSKREGALQLTPEVTYKLQNGVLLRLTPAGHKNAAGPAAAP